MNLWKTFMSTKSIYLDHNASCPLHPRVKDAMIDSLRLYGNSNAVHKSGNRAQKAIEESRLSIARFIGAHEDEIVFTSGGTESNNTILHTFFTSQTASKKKQFLKNHIITSSVEHASLFNTLNQHRKLEFELTLIGVDQAGYVDMQQLQEAIQANTSLISIQYSNHETGVIQPLHRIGELAYKKGIAFHSDAVQAYGKIPINVNELHLDYMSLSAHKIYGPKGIGALYVKRGAVFSPFVLGGHNNPKRGGTENTTGIIGLAAATETAAPNIGIEQERLLKLKEQLATKLKTNIPNININGAMENSMANTLNVTFHGVNGNTLTMFADAENIEISTGPACSAASSYPSRVLIAMGRNEDEASQSVRFSMGLSTSEEDIDYTASAISRIVHQLRKLTA